ncbi:MAG: MBL fold metallo-hydrolase [Halobacteriales archaeon]|nr:MBL fold metallo-hydrolase [Halobacteriales archaeon]
MSLNVETVRDDAFACNVYRLGDCLVDAGDDATYPPPADEIDAVCLTHAHADHAGALADYDAPVYVHPAEKDAETVADAVGDVRTVEEGDEVEMNGARFEVLHTPGHSPGSVCYWCADEGVVFSGDLLFENGAPGHADTPGGDADALRESLERLGSLDAVRAYPGHREPFDELKQKVSIAVNLV